MRSRILLCLVAGLLSASVQAFQINVRSDNPAISENVLRAEVNRISGEVGNRIPETPDIKVYVYTRAMPSKIEGQTIYLHRVQLTKAITAGPPYPTRAWLPIRSVERYGVDDAETVRAKLEETLRDFFKTLKNVDPETGAE